MLSQNVRRLVWTLFASLALCCMALSSKVTAVQKTTPTGAPEACEFQNKQCLFSCPRNPTTGDVEEWCATQCRYSHSVCESGAFGARLSPENFMLALNLGCEKYVSSYRRNCTLNNGMIPRHRPVYDACRATGLSVDVCCENIAQDFAKAISACSEEEFSPQ